jgi:hypothetical protein
MVVHCRARGYEMLFQQSYNIQLIEEVREEGKELGPNKPLTAQTISFCY